MLDNINYRTVINSLSIQDQLQIFSWVLGKSVSIGQTFCNVHRIDKSPGCFLREYQNIILITDYSHPEYSKYTCIHSVRDLMNCTLTQAAVNIYAALYFNKPLQFNNTTVVGNVQKGRKSGTKIFFNSYTSNKVPCWTKSSFEYWHKAGVKLQDLVEANVFDVSSYYINEKFITPKIKPVFAYFKPSTGHVKLYSPYESKENRFIGTTNAGDFWIVNEGNSNLIITKAVKDMLTLKNILPDWTIVTFNSEGVVCKEFDISTYSTIKILYDFDGGGIRGAETLQKHYDRGDIIYFKEYGKDAFDIATTHGLDRLKEELEKLL